MMLLPFAMVVCVHPQELQPMPMATNPSPRLSTPLTPRLKCIVAHWMELNPSPYGHCLLPWACVCTHCPCATKKKKLVRNKVGLLVLLWWCGRLGLITKVNGLENLRNIIFFFTTCTKESVVRGIMWRNFFLNSYFCLEF
jgi:hypothetical protein